jgi:hypothetical protein
LESLGVDADLCILDTGRNQGPNLDPFYDGQTCRTGYIARLSSDDANLLEVASKRLVDIRREENLVRHRDLRLFMVREEVRVGKNKDKPAWLYLGVDADRAADEWHRPMGRGKTDNGLSDAEIVLRLEREGVFAVVSGRELTCGEVLPTYYQCQAAEQIFDYVKNYTKMLPLRTHSAEAFQGHLLLSYMAACAIKLVQMRMGEASLTLGSLLQGLRNQKCRVYKGRIVTDVAQRLARESYSALGVECPASVPISGGRLVLDRPKAGSVNPRPREARMRAGKGKAAELAKGAKAQGSA